MQNDVSSRTPEGSPGHCVLCGREVCVEFSNPGDDATCPHCGNLIRRSMELLEQFESYWGRLPSRSLESLGVSSRFQELDYDSLEMVEFVMQLEATYGVALAEDDAANISTVGDAIKCILEKSR